jgi:hypothetical protein
MVFAKETTRAAMINRRFPVNFCATFQPNRIQILRKLSRETVFALRPPPRPLHHVQWS